MQKSVLCILHIHLLLLFFKLYFLGLHRLIKDLVKLRWLTGDQIQRLIVVDKFVN